MKTQATQSNNSSNSSLFLNHEPCPKCGSRDNLARFDDGHGYCFGCQYYEQPGKDEQRTPDVRQRPLTVEGLIKVEFKEIPKRQLDEDTCRRWGYGIGKFKGRLVHVAQYMGPNGTVVAQKLRDMNKDFMWLGDSKKVALYGQHLWKAGGNKIVVVEGEVDALSVSKIQSHKWPVVSVPHGAANADRAVSNSIEWLSSFQEVIFMFDQDKQGQEGAAKAAAILPPGKAFIATLPLKDANEMLMNNRGGELVSSIFKPRAWRPDGIVDGKDLWELISTPNDADSIEYPWAKLQDMTLGCRTHEIVTITAATGTGKSTICRELAHHWAKNGEIIGYIALEESLRRTALGILATELSKPVHLESEEVSKEEFRAAYDRTLGSGNWFLYDHHGSLDPENLIGKVRYLVRGLNCKTVFIDHLSILISGQADGDERRMIDNTMTELRSLVQEVGCRLILVSHLRRTERSTEEGLSRPALNLLRGSHAIGQISDVVLSAERNQQSEDSDEKDVSILRVLKNRHTGDTGVCGRLRWDKDTPRLKEILKESDAFSVDTEVVTDSEGAF